MKKHLLQVLYSGLIHDMNLFFLDGAGLDGGAGFDGEAEFGQGGKL